MLADEPAARAARRAHGRIGLTSCAAHDRMYTYDMPSHRAAPQLPIGPFHVLGRTLAVLPLLAASLTHLTVAGESLPASADGPLLFLPDLDTAPHLEPEMLKPEMLLAWRDDPRPAADTPMGVEVPPGRRGSRRAQRRSSRRRLPLDEVRIEVPPPGPSSQIPSAATAAGLNTFETTPLPAGIAIFGEGGPPPLTGNAVVPPIQADATLASPFEVARADATAITTHRDQPYGPHQAGLARHARQRFDIHLPAGCNAGGMPLVVWIHGDTWRDGSKADCPIVWLASEGYAVASIGYRLSDTAVFPAQLDDCRAAIAEIEQNAEVWGIDRSRVAVVGSGAGGHLAALVGLSTAATAASGSVATDPLTDPPADDHSPRRPAACTVAAVCAVAAPASLTTLGPDQDRAGSSASRLVGGPLPEFREAAQRASPVSHISADDPPVLIVHGTADEAVPVRQAVDFAAALKAAGVDTTLLLLPDTGHRPGLDLGSPGGQALLSFLDRVLGAGIRPQHAPRP
jgi:acetyl esterase/lipase